MVIALPFLCGDPAPLRFHADCATSSLSGDHAYPAREIAMALGSREARAHQPFCHLGCLLGGDFDGESTAFLEKVPRSLGDDQPS